MVVHKRIDKFPLLAFVLIPLTAFLIMLLMWCFLNGCLVGTKVYQQLKGTEDVLGVSTFDLSASKTKIKDNETVTYTATAVTDRELGVLTGTIVFNLAGEGRIGENIEGPGLCLRVSELRATCTAINLPVSKTLVWKVPVTAKSTCSQSATPTLTMIATQSAGGVVAETSEDTAIVTCEAATTGGNNNGGNNGGTNNNNNGNNGNNGTDGKTNDDDDDVNTSGNLSSEDVLAILNQHNDEVKACMMGKSVNLSAWIVGLLLLGLLIYFTTRGRTEKTVVTK